MFLFSDKELLDQFKNPETRSYAFNLIVRKYQKDIYKYARRIVIDHDDAYDVAQNVFIKAWNKLDTFKHESLLSTWLYRITTNESLNFLKSKKRHIFVSYEEVKNQLINTLEAGKYISGNEINIRLEKAILQLPPKQRIVFILRYYEEKSYDEISQITGTSTGALQASYHIAVKKIENNLGGD